jgi:hypothetical protein
MFGEIKLFKKKIWYHFPLDEILFYPMGLKVEHGPD